MEIEDSNLYIKDEEFENLSTVYKELATLIDDRIDKYIDLLEKMKTDDVVSGYVHRNIDAFYKKSTLLRDLMTSILNDMSNYCDDYLVQIDDADGDYY